MIFALRVLIEMYTGGQKELHLGGILENFFFKYLQLTGALAVAALEMSRGLIIFSVSAVGLLLLSGSKRAPNQNGELMISFI